MKIREINRTFMVRQIIFMSGIVSLQGTIRHEYQIPSKKTIIKFYPFFCLDTKEKKIKDNPIGSARLPGQRHRELAGLGNIPH